MIGILYKKILYLLYLGRRTEIKYVSLRFQEVVGWSGTYQERKDETKGGVITGSVRLGPRDRGND